MVTLGNPRESSRLGSTARFTQSEVVATAFFGAGGQSGPDLLVRILAGDGLIQVQQKLQRIIRLLHPVRGHHFLVERSVFVL